MNIIHIDKISYQKLVDWGNENSELIAAVSPYKNYYFKRSQIILETFSQNSLIAYFDSLHDELRYRIKYNKLQIAKGKIIPTPDEPINDFSVEYELIKQDNDLEIDDIKCIIDIFASAYIYFNALIIYGNLVDGSSTTVRARSEDNDKHYFIKEFQNKLYAITSSTHRSPEGVFSVRGHFRKYKSGKVIWIDEFLKGTKENKK